MFAEISAAFASLKTASEIINTLHNVKTSSELSAKTLELNQIIIAMQQQLFAAQSLHRAQADQIKDLEDRIASMQSWEAEKQHYKPFRYDNKSVVFRPVSDSESYDLCPACFDNRKKSILQYNGTDKGYKAYKCPQCQTVIYTEALDYCL